MINLSIILDDPQIITIYKKFPNIKINYDGSLFDESIKCNTCEIYVKYKIDVFIKFGFFDKETNRIIYDSHDGKCIGTKLDENSDKFKPFPNIKQLEKIWLEKYDDWLVCAAINKIKLQSEQLSELEENLLSIDNQYQIYDNYLISNNEKIYMSELEKIKRITNADQLIITGEIYNWKIEWFIAYDPKYDIEEDD